MGGRQCVRRRRQEDALKLEEAYAQIWKGKMTDCQPPERQSIDRVRWTAELFPREASAGPLVDLGTGSGAMLAEAARRAWKAYGTEIAEDVRRWLGARGFDVFRTDLNHEKVPLEDGSAGIVTACDVIEHITDPAHMLREARRLLRPGGRLFVSTPNAAFWRRVQSLAAGTMFRTSGDQCLRDGGHVAYYAPADFKSSVEASGFVDAKLHFRKHDPAPPAISKALAALGARNQTWVDNAYMILEARR